MEYKHIKDILLDTGCSKTFVCQELVSEGRMLPGKTATIHCVCVCGDNTIHCLHGDNVPYPVARLDLEVEGGPIAVEAAVAKNLPTSVLVGTDVPELGRLLGLKPRPSHNKMLAVTRACARRQAQEKKERCQKEADSQV